MALGHPKTPDLTSILDARIDGARTAARQIEQFVATLDEECHGPFAELARRRASDLERIARVFELARPNHNVEDERPAA